MRTPSSPRHHRQLLAAALGWLAGGGLLLASTLVPAHTDALGWTPAFWLLAAPLVLLLALEPSLPRRLLATRRPRRRMVRLAAWH